MSRRHQTAAGTNPSYRVDALAFPDRGPRARTAATFVMTHKQVTQVDNSGGNAVANDNDATPLRVR